MAEKVKVLLKRNWQVSGIGRFEKSNDGIPTPIPRNVLDRHPLPSDPTIVSDDYVPPHQREGVAADSLDAVMTEAEIEQAVNRRVEAQLRRRDAEKRGEELEAVADEAAKRQIQLDALDSSVHTEAETNEGEDILDNSIPEIVSELNDMSEEQLRDLLEREKGGKTRKSLVAEIEAALEEFEGDES